MSDTNGAASPASEQADSAPAASEQAKPNAGVVTDAATDAESTLKPEGAEADTGTEAEAGDDAADDKPVKLTRNQRLQRKAARLATMLAEREAELEGFRAKAKTEPLAGSSEPKEADYNGDYTAYLADRAAWKATQSITQKLDERDQRSNAERLAVRRSEAVSDFEDRADELKTRIPDFDKTIESYAKAGGKLAPHVIEELQESEQGPLLLYQLAKQPAKIAELNAMSARDAAREIGRLEAKASLPEPKKQTQAPAPLAPLKGGASQSKDISELAKSEDITEFVKADEKRQKARA